MWAKQRNGRVFYSENMIETKRSGVFPRKESQRQCTARVVLNLTKTATFQSMRSTTLKTNCKDVQRH